MNNLVPIVACVALVAVAAPAAAHEREIHFTLYPGPCLFDVFDPTGMGTSMPNTGIGCWVIETECCHSFTLTADDGQEPFVVGTADECPGPDTFDPTNPDWWLNDFWVLCNNHPDVDIKMSCGPYDNGPGDEAGETCDGIVVVYLFFGMGPENFTWRET